MTQETLDKFMMKLFFWECDRPLQTLAQKQEAASRIAAAVVDCGLAPELHEAYRKAREYHFRDSIV